MRLLLVLLSGSTSIFVNAVSLPRLRVAGITAAERALVSSAAETAAGSKFTLEQVPVPDLTSMQTRIVIFDGFDIDADEWLLQTIAEELDQAEIDPMLLTAAPAEATVQDAIDAHIERYGLRQPLRTRTTSWNAAHASLASHVTLDGAMVDHPGVAPWWDVSSVAVYDGVVDEALRSSLLSLLASDGWDPEVGADPNLWERGTFNDAQTLTPADGVSMRANGWGLNFDALQALCSEEEEEEGGAGERPAPMPEPILELQSRLVSLLRAANPDGVSFDVCRQSDAVFGGAITPLTANAPVHADGNECYGWHIDADPALLPPSPWTDLYGRHPNRLAGAPRFVTALVYLSPEWKTEWGAPTRFLDPPTGDVYRVEPRPGRLILMDQDLTHAVSAPSEAAGDRPRYSLVFKLVLHPRPAAAASTAAAGDAAGRDGDGKRKRDEAVCIRLADPKWGGGSKCFGSACNRGETRTRQPANEYNAAAAELAANVEELKLAAEQYYGPLTESSAD